MIPASWSTKQIETLADRIIRDVRRIRPTTMIENKSESAGFESWQVGIDFGPFVVRLMALPEEK